MTSQFLATTALEEFWDKSGPIHFLNEGAMRFSRRDAIAGLHCVDLGLGWPMQGEVDAAHSFLISATDGLIEDLSPALNEAHGTTHSVEYWRILLYCWTSQFLCVLTDRWQLLAKAAEILPSMVVSGSGNGPREIAADSWEFGHWVRQDAFNQTFMADVAAEMGLICANFECPVPALPRRPVPRGRFKRIRNLVNRAAQSYRAPNSLLMRESYFDSATLFNLTMRSGGRIRPVHPPAVAFDVPHNPKVRASLECALHVSGTGIEPVAKRLVARHLPRCFLEGYSSLCDAAEAMYPSAPRAIFTANGLYYDETFKQWAAARKEMGTLLLGVQHGGTFGVMRGLVGVEFELSATDRFYSWGHRANFRGYEAIPMPAPKMMSLPRTRSRNRDTSDILFGGNIAPRFNQAGLLCCAPKAFRAYLDWQARFATSLDAAARQALRYRMHEVDLGWDVAERLKAAIPDMQMDDRARTFRQSLATCRLFVSDYIGTIYAEALAAGVPTILFWNPDLNPLTDEAQPIFDELRLQRILHDSPESAAREVSQAYLDVDAWWSAPDRQSAVTRFCNSFALRRGNARKLWLSEFNQILCPSGIDAGEFAR